MNIIEIKTNLSTLKNYFIEILDIMEKDCIEKLKNEKQQNISNILELEQKLKEVLSNYTQEKDARLVKEQEKHLSSFNDLFNFTKQFKDESYSMIISQPIKLDLDMLKSQLSVYSEKFLNRLYESPKAFLTQLYGFFLNNQEQGQFAEDSTYGKALTLDAFYPKRIEVETLGVPIQVNVGDNFRAPIMNIISNEYLCVATRD